MLQSSKMLLPWVDDRSIASRENRQVSGASYILFICLFRDNISQMGHLQSNSVTVTLEVISVTIILSQSPNKYLFLNDF